MDKVTTVQDSEVSSHTSMLLRGLSAVDQDELLALGQRRKYKSGNTIFARGDEGTSLLVIEKGRVEISITAASGRKSVLDHMGPGGVLGEIAIFDDGTRSADAVAASEVIGISVSREALLGFLRKKPNVAIAMIEELCAKVRNASEMFEAQAQVDAQSRLARCLMRMASKWGKETADGTIKVDEGFSQTDIGEFSGLARENVNRRLKAWEADGLLRFKGSVLIIEDPDQLEEIADL
jgi:CRP-like cAMP-binding protein